MSFTLHVHSEYIELTTCTLIFAKIRKDGSKISKIRPNFSPCKSNGSKFSCALISYPNFLALVTPDITITSFVGRNKRNKVSVKKGGAAKKKRIYRISAHNIVILETSGSTRVQVQQNDARFSSITRCTMKNHLRVTLFSL